MTKVDIWNTALGAVGHDTRVESETEDSAEAFRCRLFWNLARRACLRRADWGFAMERAPLGRAAAVVYRGRGTRRKVSRSPGRSAASSERRNIMHCGKLATIGFRGLTRPREADTVLGCSFLFLPATCP